MDTQKRIVCSNLLMVVDLLFSANCRLGLRCHQKPKQKCARRRSLYERPSRPINIGVSLVGFSVATHIMHEMSEVWSSLLLELAVVLGASPGLQSELQT